MSEQKDIDSLSDFRNEQKPSYNNYKPGAYEKESLDPESEIEELEPSELGTKTHWEGVYQDEMNVFDESGVVDEGWFGCEVETKVLRYMDNLNTVQKNDPIIDLGCGNGSLLCELANREYTNLTGIDYSETAIKLASALFKSRKLEGRFQVRNILEDEAGDLGKFRVCLDKGTFDAVSLCPDFQLKEAKAKYFQFVLKILEDEGSFILISCNWTTSELVTLSKEWFDLNEVIPTQKFNFGGHPGSLVSIAVMKKKSVNL